MKPCPNIKPCPVDCVCEWADWDDCDATCEKKEGTRTRQCEVKTEAKHGGAECPGPEQDTCGGPPPKDCPCEPDCDLSEWTEWGQCSVPCGGQGTQKRTRKINTPPEEECLCGCLEESQPCDNGCCKVDCEVGEWSQWSACDDVCGGTKTRERKVIKAADCGGKDCGPLEESEDCPASGCGPPSSWDPWTDWAAIPPTVTCGKGWRKRTRSHGNPSITCEKKKKCAEEVQEWLEKECPKCEYYPWEAWSSCHDDGYGTCVKDRKREAVGQMPNNPSQDCQCEWDAEPCSQEECS